MCHHLLTRKGLLSIPEVGVHDSDCLSYDDSVRLSECSCCERHWKGCDTRSTIPSRDENAAIVARGTLVDKLVEHNRASEFDDDVYDADSPILRRHLLGCLCSTIRALRSCFLVPTSSLNSSSASR
jgi:hypothetical protein